ncbi:MAG: hypothetical protein V8S87_02085 [Oscillospiraceae bacterium]
MQDITEIMDMLDWHKLPEIQTKGDSSGKRCRNDSPVYTAADAGT